MKHTVTFVIGVAVLLASWASLVAAPAPLPRPPRDVVGRYVGWAEIGDNRIEIVYTFNKDDQGEMTVLGNAVRFEYQYTPGGKLQTGPAGWSRLSFRVERQALYLDERSIGDALPFTMSRTFRRVK
jgi:hypothetical protein